MRSRFLPTGRWKHTVLVKPLSSSPMVGYDSQIPGMTIKWNTLQDEFVKAALLNTKYYDMKSKLGKNCGIARTCGGTVLVFMLASFLSMHILSVLVCVCLLQSSINFLQSSSTGKCFCGVWSCRTLECHGQWIVLTVALLIPHPAFFRAWAFTSFHILSGPASNFLHTSSGWVSQHQK